MKGDFIDSFDISDYRVFGVGVKPQTDPFYGYLFPPMPPS
jgi:hypothetical protein